MSLGSCADPRKSGVVSEHPQARSAPRDLNGDGASESIYADRSLCRGENCFWNLFTQRQGCPRYIGTVAGSVLELDASSGEQGFSSLRSWWKLGHGSRFLVHNYRYEEGAYRLVDVLLCRQDGDDRLLCASEEPLPEDSDD